MQWCVASFPNTSQGFQSSFCSNFLDPRGGGSPQATSFVARQCADRMAQPDERQVIASRLAHSLGSAGSPPGWPRRGLAAGSHLPVAPLVPPAVPRFGFGWVPTAGLFCLPVELVL